MVRALFAILSSALLLVGCGNLPASSRSSLPSDPGPGFSSGSPVRDDLIRAVARSRTQLETYEVGFHWVGSYAGQAANGCERVRLTLVNAGHDTHYLVCGSQISEIGDVAPAVPKDPRLGRTLENLSQAAWRTGQAQSMLYGGYELHAVPVGLPRHGCVHVERRIVFGDMLVQADTIRVCGR